MAKDQGKVECPYCHETIGFSVRKEQKQPCGLFFILLITLIISIVTASVLLACSYGYCG